MKKVISELRRRNIFDVVAIYAVVGWVLIEVADVVLPTFGAPNWMNQAIILLFVLGLPVVVTQRFFFYKADEPEHSSDSNDELQTAANVTPQETKGINRPSIAVLPFENLSDDEQKRYLADGMTEDIIAGLSFNPHLTVLSRRATMVYRNNPTDLREIGTRLGVRYLLEGSIRPVGDRIRVSAQLIESSSGEHLWGEKYDRPATEMSDVQDDVIAEIIGTLDAQISTAEIRRASNRSTENLDAWGLLQKTGLWTFTPTKGGFEKSKNLSRMAIRKDPNYALAHATLAFALRGEAINGYSADIAAAFKESTEHASLAIALEPNDPVNLRWVGCAHIYGSDVKKGIHYLQRSLMKSPNDGVTLMHLALGLGITRDFDKADECFVRARSVAPSGGLSIGYDWYEALVRTWEGRYAEAEELIKDFILHVPEYPGSHMYLGMVQARQDRFEEARNSIQKGIALAPGIDYSNPPLFLTSVRPPEGEIKTSELLVKVWP
ncbi:MAG: TolB-like protein [Kiritimatiellia bacterium]|jgi:TolB-like protein